MSISKVVAVVAVVCGLVAAQVAFAAGLKVAATPTSPKVGKKVEMRVTGLKPGERVKAVLTLAVTGQKNTYYPRQRASSTGALINTITAQEKGKNTWKYTGRQSRRTGSVSFTVR